MSKPRMLVKHLKKLLERADEELPVTIRVTDSYGQTYEAKAGVAGEDVGNFEMFEFILEGVTPEAEQEMEEEEGTCCSKEYFCPTSGETECPRHGGFTPCCDKPELHREAEK